MASDDRMRHGRLLTEIRARLELANQAIARVQPIWDSVEDNYRAFRPMDSKDHESWEKHRVTKIVVPMSFAIIQTIQSLMFEIITNRVPILPVPGREQDDVKPAIVMESIIAFQADQNDLGVRIYNWLQDFLLYGVGVAASFWHRQVETRQITRQRPVNQNLFGVQFQRTEDQVSSELVPVKEQNRAEIVDPYVFWRDPRFPLSRFQEGEFAGHRTLATKSSFRRMVAGDNQASAEQGLQPPWINIEEAMRSTPNQEEFMLAQRHTRRERFTFPQDTVNRLSPSMQPISLDYLIVDLVPNAPEWNVGESPRPTKWMFVVANKSTIVQSNPFSAGHDMFPYAVAEPFPDSHSTHNPGVAELMMGLQGHLDFLFNSHMTNVRKVINDMLVVDPSRVEMQDLLNPAAGRLIRLSRNAYGTDPASVAKQLQVVDVTQNHISDSGFVMSLMQRVTGASDTLQGQPTKGRRSASEMTNALKGAANRIKTMLGLFYGSGLIPMSRQWVGNTQKFMTLERAFRIAGPIFNELSTEERMTLFGGKAGFSSSPETMNQLRQTSFEDFPSFETMFPSDRQDSAKTLLEVFKGVIANPPLMQVFDVVQMFIRIARELGVKDVRKFIKGTSIQLSPEAALGGGAPGGGGGATPPTPSGGNGTSRSPNGTGTSEGRALSAISGQTTPEVRP